VRNKSLREFFRKSYQHLSIFFLGVLGVLGG
jgi:hypothetical protein